MSQKRAKKVSKRNKKKSTKKTNSFPSSKGIFFSSHDESLGIQLPPQGSRFSSINTEYNSAYDYSDELQISCGVEENNIETLDEDGVVSVLSKLNNLVEQGLLSEESFTKFKALYEVYFAVWCIHVTTDKPEDPAPYMDWWREEDNFVCLTKNGNLQLPIPNGLKLELATTWVAKEIVKNQALHREVDDLVFYDDLYITKYHKGNWLDNANKIRTEMA